MNDILLFLSQYKEVAEASKYASDEGSITGTQTSDAPTKYLLTHAKNEGNDIDQILCITSRSVKNKGYDEYEKMVYDYCHETGINTPRIIMIPYDFSEERESGLTDIEKTNQTYQNLVKYVRSGDMIYIDYTGGLRDTSFFMTVLIHYMKYIGADCKEIVYSNYFGEKKIVSVNYIYELFDVINGISEFMQSGNANLLSQTVLKNTDIEKKFPQIKCLLDAMKKFADMIALCTVDRRVDSVLKELKEAILEVQKIPDDIQSEDEIAIQMLKNLLGEIQRKLFIDEDAQSISYLQIIRWCVENHMLQQAITFYIEKTPDILYDANLILKFEMDTKSKNRGSTEGADQFYKVLYDQIADRVDESFQMYVSILEKDDVMTSNVEEIISTKKNNNPKLDWNLINEKILGIKEYLDCRYDQKGKNHLDNSIVCELDDKINAKKKEGALRDIRSKNYLKLVYYGENKKKETYPKKVEALEHLRELECQRYGRIKNNDLLVCLEIYLVLKVIRNQINHANESEGDEVVRQYLVKYHKPYTTEITVENIMKILLSGIDKIQSILNDPVYEKLQDGEFLNDCSPLGDLTKVDFGEFFFARVAGVDGTSIIVEDQNGVRAELKSKKMTDKTRDLFAKNQIVGKVIQVRCVNMTSKKCPYVVEEK